MNKIKVTHLGEDYSTIEVNGYEFEASLGLGQELLKVLKEQKKVESSLDTIVDYLFKDEQKDCEAQDNTASHIFHDIVRVRDWLES